MIFSSMSEHGNILFQILHSGTPKRKNSASKDTLIKSRCYKKAFSIFALINYAHTFLLSYQALHPHAIYPL